MFGENLSKIKLIDRTLLLKVSENCILYVQISKWDIFDEWVVLKILGG